MLIFTMKLSTFFTLAIASSPALVNARCFGGGNLRPDHGIEVVEFFYAAGCEVQSGAALTPGQEYFKHGKSSDGKCLNVKVKNNGGADYSASSNQLVDAWIREWVGCEHGGTSSYPDGLEYA